jgi:hypothetical protein
LDWCTIVPSRSDRKGRSFDQSNAPRSWAVLVKKSSLNGWLEFLSVEPQPQSLRLHLEDDPPQERRRFGYFMKARTGCAI